MIGFPFCKINIGLFITKKRDDGFHNLESVFFPVPWCDTLEIESSKTPGLELLTYGNGVGPIKSNIIQGAYNALGNISGIRCHLIKNIPHGAGLGGGSSDAAHFLKMCNVFLALGKSKKELDSIALGIGSDCPFFLENKAKYVEGRGEKFSDIELGLSGLHLVVIYPKIVISTAEAYAHITPNMSRPPLRQSLGTNIRNWTGQVVNDFEAYALENHPKLKEVKNSFTDQGALYSSMSGSGSAWFGFFKSKPDLTALRSRGSLFHVIIP